MKTSITTAAIAALALLAATPRAEARDHHRRHRHEPESRIYISGYRSCGTPIYQERYFVGYDCYGRPIWCTRIVEGPRYYRPEPRPQYYSAPVCPPPYGGYRDSRIVIQGSFRL